MGSYCELTPDTTIKTWNFHDLVTLVVIADNDQIVALRTQSASPRTLNRRPMATDPV
jgi:hypothetical protein